MIFYEIEATPDHPAELVGTQADAKALARERGCAFSQADVPTDKAGLMAYVNNLLGAIHDGESALSEKAGDPEPQETEPVGWQSFKQLDEKFSNSPPPKAEPITDPTDVEDFILNRATQRQVEELFARLGTRFAENARGR